MGNVRESGRLGDLRRNLLAGYRLAVGRKFSREDFVFSLDQILLLVLVLLAVILTGSFLGTESPASFDPDGLNYLGAVYLFNLLLFLMIVRIAGGAKAEFGLMLTAFVSAYVVISVLMEFVWQIDNGLQESMVTIWALFGVFLLWECYVLARLLRGVERKDGQSALGLALFYALVSVGSVWIFPSSQLWYTERSTALQNPYAELYRLNVEDTYYAQRQLMEQSVAGLKQHRPGVPDLYFMGIGGYGLEDVFLKEVEYVRRQFDEDYGTQGRSMVLVNNPKTIDRYPLANRHNLDEGLSAMAAKMDLENDVLFLFLTSHGSKRHRFALEMGPFRLNDLTPQQLRTALDASGIKWRVVVVSSCYSGGFVEPLMDPGTVVITAAAKDKTSFGCGAGSDFTDFGTAYFKEALKHEPRFVQAFDIATRWVSEKEQAEKRTASEPQRFVGEAVEDKLTALYEEPVMQAVLSGVPESVVDCSDAGASTLCQ